MVGTSDPEPRLDVRTHTGMNPPMGSFRAKTITGPSGQRRILDTDVRQRIAEDMRRQIQQQQRRRPSNIEHAVQVLNGLQWPYSDKLKGRLRDLLRENEEFVRFMNKEMTEDKAFSFYNDGFSDYDIMKEPLRYCYTNIYPQKMSSRQSST